MEMSIRRVIQEGLTPSKREDGRLWREEQALEAAKKFAENVRPLNLQ